MTNAQHIGTCHCGRVTLTIPRAPDYVSDCNCSLCQKVSGLWGYFDPAEVRVAGETQTYTRADMEVPAIRTHFCAVCGCTTHWSAASALAKGRMGINMRLFEDEAVAGGGSAEGGWAELVSE